MFNFEPATFLMVLGSMFTKQVSPVGVSRRESAAEHVVTLNAMPLSQERADESMTSLASKQNSEP